eukprot:1370202-Rhodomonas_salina.1
MASPDRLKQLDGPLLGKFWPVERVAMGLRVSRWVREQLQKNVQRVELRCCCSERCQISPAVSQHSAAEVDLFQFQHSAVEIEIHASRSYHVYSILSGNTHAFAVRCLGLTYTVLHLGVASCLVRGWVGLITVINLEGSSLQVDSIVQLRSITSKCRGLRRLDLSGNNINPDVQSFFLGTLMGCTALTHLNLSHNQLGGHDDALCALGEVLRKCTRLTHLILKDTELDNGGIAQLQSSLSVCTNIQHLDLSCGRLTPFGAAKLAQVFESWSVNLQFVTSVFTALQSSDRRSC